MNREQMIAWLTLEGWSANVVDGNTSFDGYPLYVVTKNDTQIVKYIGHRMDKWELIDDTVYQMDKGNFAVFSPQEVENLYSYIQENGL